MKSISTWTTIEDPCLFDLPKGGGCYAIYLNGALAYIGQSTNLRARLATYRFRNAYGPGFWTPWGHVNNIAVKVKMPRRYGEWAMIELRLIKRLQPPMNCAGSTKKRMVNVKA